jgi:methylated-DNA-[protein]-cysteine S-methyltransferase
MNMKYTLVSTAFGWLAVTGSEKGLYSLIMPQPTPEAALARVGRVVGDAVKDDYAFGDLPERLKGYFDGERIIFDDRLDLNGATEFQRTVWETTRTIPYGQTRSYAWVAGKIGNPRACRAVGNALSRNRLSIIIPCHRVISSDGGLGGFGDDLKLKVRLLELEGNR